MTVIRASITDRAARSLDIDRAVPAPAVIVGDWPRCQIVAFTDDSLASWGADEAHLV